MIREFAVEPRMIREFAVEPDLLTNWERCRYLTEKFGVSKGKLISRYPKNWHKMVYAGLDQMTDLREMDRARIVERLNEIKENKMLKRDFEWDQSIDWMTNAERENVRRSFDGIIGTANPRRHQCVLVYEDLDENHYPVWEFKTEYIVSRTAKDLASMAASLLRISAHVVFIDPYIDPYKKKIVESLREFLKACVDGRHKVCPLHKVEFFTEYDERISNYETKFRQELHLALLPLISNGIVVTVSRLKERAGYSQQGADGLHNRYILTERGGLSYRWGLDAGRTGQTDDVSLLNQATWDKHWQEYLGNDPAFDLVDRFEVGAQCDHELPHCR